MRAIGSKRALTWREGSYETPLRDYYDEFTTKFVTCENGVWSNASLQTFRQKLERIGKNKRLVEVYNSMYSSNKPDMEFKDLASSIDKHNEAIE